MDEYEKKAESFLKATKTKMFISFWKMGKHFEGDEVERDIYDITLIRECRSWTFQFGNSLGHSGRFLVEGKRLHTEEEARAFLKQHYGVYAGGAGSKGCVKVNKDFREPTPYDVLSVLTKYPPGPLSEFCADYGYDEDSRTVERIYNAVKDEYINLERLFNEAELDELRRIS